MFLDCISTGHKKFQTDMRGIIKILEEGGLIGKKGDLKEEVTIYMGGPFFKGLIKNENAFPWVFSTFDIDREEERIDPLGWDLKNYLENPMVLWSHERLTPAIGYALDTGISEGKLKGNIVFNQKEFDSFGWGIGERVKFGSIRSGSVGFLVRRIEIASEGDDNILIFRNQELLEFSICNVPANPFALSESGRAKESIEQNENIKSFNSFFKGLVKKERKAEVNV